MKFRARRAGSESCGIQYYATSPEEVACMYARDIFGLDLEGVRIEVWSDEHPITRFTVTAEVTYTATEVE